MKTGAEAPACYLLLPGFSGPVVRLLSGYSKLLIIGICLVCADYVRRLSGCLLTLIHAVETRSSPLIWRWAESNRRPTCFRFAGITTILTFYASPAPGASIRDRCGFLGNGAIAD